MSVVSMVQVNLSMPAWGWSLWVDTGFLPQFLTTLPFEIEFPTESRPLVFS